MAVLETTSEIESKAKTSTDNQKAVETASPITSENYGTTDCQITMKLQLSTLAF